MLFFICLFYFKTKLELDNSTKSLIENSANKLVFLAPDSLDFNPIEKFWASFKKKFKGCVKRFSLLAEAIGFCFKHDHLNFK